jgi:hypothetical protein
MIVASLFGVPAGLEVHRIAIGEESQIKFEDSWVDISLNEVSLTDDADIFRVFRLNVSGKILTWIGLYRPATEIGPNRGGGFYGAGLWLIDATVSSKVVHEVIVNLADQIRDLAMQNGKFLKRISDIRSSIVPPPQVALLVSGREKLTGGVTLKDREGGLAFIADTKNIIEAIDWAQNSSTAGFYSQVIAAPANQFVAQQSQFLKGFVLFGKVSAAIDAAYQSSIQTIKITKEQLKSKQDELAGKVSELKMKDAELNSIETQLLKAEEGLKSQALELSRAKNEVERLKTNEKSFRSENNTLKSENSQLSKQIDAWKLEKLPNHPVRTESSAGIGYQPGSLPQGKASGAGGIAKMSEPDKSNSFFYTFYFKAFVFFLCLCVSALSGYLRSDYLKNKIYEGKEKKLQNKITELEINPNLLDYIDLENGNVYLQYQIDDLNNKNKGSSTKPNSSKSQSNDYRLSIEDEQCINSLGILRKMNFQVKYSTNKKLLVIPTELTENAYKKVSEACIAKKAVNKKCIAVFNHIQSESIKSLSKSSGEIFFPEKCTGVTQIDLSKNEKIEIEISRNIK